MSEQSEKLFEAIGLVDETLLESARVRHRPNWRAITAAAACLALVIGFFAAFPLRMGSSSAPPESADGAAPDALASAVYPVMAPYPIQENYVNQDGSMDDEAWTADYQAWRESVERQKDQPAGYAEGLKTFARTSAAAFLAGHEGENMACSPANLYMALAMLSEATAGESQAQLLSLLGADSIEALRAQAKSVWNANYRDDGLTKSLLASALWLRDGANYNAETVNRLAEDYYATVFSGEMGSPDYDEALRDWLNQQTEGLLSEQTAQEHLDPETLLALTTTIYFRASWVNTFFSDNTVPETFHGAGGDETADFMRQSDSLPYHKGETFSAVGLELRSGGTMWFLLPEEGVTPEALLENEDAMTFFAAPDIGSTQNPLVHLALPKFDVSSRFSLLDGLRTLGVTDVCDPAKADFSPLGETENGAYLSDATHAARVTIDEEGVIAAAYTMMAVGEGAPDFQREITFTLDRPFLYVITGDQGAPLFMGIVNTVA